MNINTVILSGRLTKEVDVKVTSSSKKYCNFTLAVSKDKDSAYFINCIAWEKLAEVLENYTQKGNRINVVGKLTSRSYDGNNGKVYVTEVVCNQIELLETKTEKTQETVKPTILINPVNDEELPF